jgi:hypothetical protein
VRSWRCMLGCHWRALLEPAGLLWACDRCGRIGLDPNESNRWVNIYGEAATYTVDHVSRRLEAPSEAPGKFRVPPHAAGPPAPKLRHG